jgi:hypothetical protein
MDIFNLFNMEPASPEDYHKQINAMWCRMQDWRSKNADKNVMIAFKTPPKVGKAEVVIICPIHTALQLGFVTVNEHGYEMLKAMCEPCGDAQPTVAMVQAAIDLNPPKKGKK